MIDRTAGNEVATLSMFKLIDLETQAEVYSTTVPKTANGTYNAPPKKWVYAYLNYARTGNVPPVAEIAAGPTAGFAPLTVAFDGSGSSDSDGTIVSYSWDFGDGGGAAGVQVSHTYSTPGDYTATLTVTDDRGAKSSDSVAISVEAYDPNFIPAPSDLYGQVSSRTVTLTWKDNSFNEEGFSIERGSHPQYAYQQVGQVGRDVTVYSESAGPGRYRYRVRAFNSTTGRVSDYSNVVEVRVR